MSYSSIEASVQDGSPVELYQFEQGVSTWRFSSSQDQVVFNNVVFSPYPIQRDRVKQSQDVFKNTMKLRFPRGSEFASQFIGFSPDEITTVTIFRGHATDTLGEFEVYWKGRIMGASVSDQTVDLECEPIFTSLRRPGLRAKYEYTCRHTLYGRGCEVAKELYRLDGAIISASNGTDIQVAGANAQPDGYYVGGLLISPDSIGRFIVGQSGDILTINRPLASLIVAATVSIFPGCDHLLATCGGKFNNSEKFGGFPWVPTRNPFNGNSIV